MQCPFEIDLTLKMVFLVVVDVATKKIRGLKRNNG
jgi:hypothetical protein